MSRIEPNAHIYIAAKQFHDAAKLLSNKKHDVIDHYIYPIIANYAFACELALKATEATVTSKDAQSGALLYTGETESTSWGHNLPTVFQKLQPNTKTAILDKFKQHTGKSLEPLLTECGEYFVKARYPWDKNKLCKFSLSSVSELSAGLIAVIPKLRAA